MKFLGSFRFLMFVEISEISGRFLRFCGGFLGFREFFRLQGCSGGFREFSEISGKFLRFQGGF